MYTSLGVGASLRQKRARGEEVPCLGVAVVGAPGCPSCPSARCPVVCRFVALVFCMDYLVFCMGTKSGFDSSIPARGPAGGKPLPSRLTASKLVAHVFCMDPLVFCMGAKSGFVWAGITLEKTESFSHLFWPAGHSRGHRASLFS